MSEEVAERLPDSHFEHKPLDPTKAEIRLVRILPQVEGGSPTLRCESERRNLDRLQPKTTSIKRFSRPVYKALSYIWEPEEPSREIEVDGCPLRISPNLWEFLFTISGSDRPTSKDSIHDFWWIDQICVNQEDAEERNHQAALKSRVYSHALVVIWLGNICYEDAKVVLAEDTTGVLKAMAKNPYWTQLWVIQEICRANDVSILWGKYAITGKEMVWDDFSDFSNTARDVPAEGDGMVLLTNIVNARRLLVRCGAITWQDAYMASRHSECADIKDKIYGLLGLIHPDAVIEVDYNKSLEEIYNDMINAERRVRNLSPSHSKVIERLWRRELKLE